MSNGDREMQAPVEIQRKARAWGSWGSALRLSGCAVALACMGLAGCGSVGLGVGFGIPIGPLSVGVGLGSGGLSAGVGTGLGPIGVGVGVNQSGQVLGSAGVGASTGVGGASVGVGVGTSTVLHDPNQPRAVEGQVTPASAPSSATSAEPLQGQSSQAGQVQWRDARGQVVPACKVEGRC